jgi:hypothetical protein
MDLLFWKHLNPNIVHESTRKQFYGKFCYKLVLEAFAGRVINDDRSSITDAINLRIQTARTLNYGGSWRINPISDLQKASESLLTELRSIKNGYEDKIKIRIEEPWVQIYTSDEGTLKDIANRFDVNDRKSLISVSTPESTDHQALLEEGCIIVKKDNGYKYKVFIRDGNYGVDSKHNLLNYLKELGPEVKFSQSVINQLSTKYPWVWGCYFYTNDLQLITTISLISPGIVGKIHELKVVEQ